jgi:DNA-binding MarR family transcriptional regulator
VQATDVRPRELAAALLELWRRVVAGHEGETFALLDELGLSLTQVKTLTALDTCAEQLSVGELSERLGISLAASSRTVDGLLRRGWVERREDDHDRRLKRIRLTAAGRDVAARITTARLKGLEAFAASLGPEERDRLHAALTAIHPHD